jgi:hypothetical protein
MNETTLSLKNSPQFMTDGEGNPTLVTLAPPTYITLLIRANVTDAALWTPGLEHAARILAQVRAVEVDCITAYGEFDWEKLSEVAQDEYDGLCALLDELQDTGERVPLHDLLTEVMQTAAWTTPQLS